MVSGLYSARGVVRLATPGLKAMKNPQTMLQAVYAFLLTYNVICFSVLDTLLGETLIEWTGNKRQSETEIKLHLRLHAMIEIFQ